MLMLRAWWARRRGYGPPRRWDYLPCAHSSAVAHAWGRYTRFLRN